MSVVDSIDFSKYTLAGFIDERRDMVSFLGYPVLAHDFIEIKNPEIYRYFVAIGDNEIRCRWYKRLQSSGMVFANIIDKTAIISESAVLGSGNFVGKYAVINAGSVIGDDNIINTRALIEHRCVVGSHTHISTGTVLNGDVCVGDGTFMGSSSVTNGQTHIGAWSIVGSGSAVIRNIGDNVVAVGVPARPIKTRTAHE